MTDQSYSVLIDASYVVSSMAFSPDSRWLATVQSDGFVRVYIVHETKGTPRRPTLHFTIDHDGQNLFNVAFSADSNWLVFTGGGWESELRMYALNGNSPVLAHTFTARSHYQLTSNAVAFSGDSKWLAWATVNCNKGGVSNTARSASKNSYVDLYGLRSGQPPMLKFTLKTPANPVNIAFSGDSKWLVTGDEKGLIKLYNIEASGPVLRHTLTDPGLTDIAVSKDSKWIASTKTGEVRVYAWEDGSTPSLRYNVNVSGVGAATVAFSGDSKSVVIGWNWNGLRKSVGKLQVYALEGSSPTLQFEAEPFQPFHGTFDPGSVAFSADSKWIASGSSEVYVYFLQSRAPMRVGEKAWLIV